MFFSVIQIFKKYIQYMFHSIQTGTYESNIIKQRKICNSRFNSPRFFSPFLELSFFGCLLMLSAYSLQPASIYPIACLEQLNIKNNVTDSHVHLFYGRHLIYSKSDLFKISSFYFLPLAESILFGYEICQPCICIENVEQQVKCLYTFVCLKTKIEGLSFIL